MKRFFILLFSSAILLTSRGFAMEESSQDYDLTFKGKLLPAPPANEPLESVEEFTKKFCDATGVSKDYEKNQIQRTFQKIIDKAFDDSERYKTANFVIQCVSTIPKLRPWCAALISAFDKVYNRQAFLDFVIRKRDNITDINFLKSRFFSAIESEETQWEEAIKKNFVSFPELKKEKETSSNSYLEEKEKSQIGFSLTQKYNTSFKQGDLYRNSGNLSEGLFVRSNYQLKEMENRQNFLAFTMHQEPFKHWSPQKEEKKPQDGCSFTSSDHSKIERNNVISLKDEEEKEEKRNKDRPQSWDIRCQRVDSGTLSADNKARSMHWVLENKNIVSKKLLEFTYIIDFRINEIFGEYDGWGNWEARPFLRASRTGNYVFKFIFTNLFHSEEEEKKWQQDKITSYSKEGIEVEIDDSVKRDTCSTSTTYWKSNHPDFVYCLSGFKWKYKENEKEFDQNKMARSKLEKILNIFVENEDLPKETADKFLKYINENFKYMRDLNENYKHTRG